MSDVFFTSDEHYWHTNVIPYCARPFVDVEEMNEKMIEAVNAVVKKGDRVYHLGDFAMGNVEKKKKILNRLNGQHFLIKGNHDDKTTCKLPWAAVYDCKGIRIDGQYIWMNHYPLRSWNLSYHGAWSIFGHVHGRCMPWGKSCDVGVDAWDYRPVSFGELKEFMDQQPMLSEYARDSFVPTGNLWKGPDRDIRPIDGLGAPINDII